VGRDPASIAAFVRTICADTELWGTDLAAVPGFVDVVADDLATILEHGPVAAIEALGLTQVR
jgi:mannitol-1-phosphate/altronate dehydrogenase